MIKEENIKKIVLIVALLFIVFGLLFWIMNKEEEQVVEEPSTYLSLDYQSIENNMNKLKTVAERFKEENGSYNLSDNNVFLDHCSFNKSIFIGSGNANVLCSNLWNAGGEGMLSLVFNKEKGENSKYCIQKTLNDDNKIVCMDYSGYIGLSSSGCGNDYSCARP